LVDFDLRDRADPVDERTAKPDLCAISHMPIDQITFPTSMRLALIVRNERRRKGLNQKALARAADVGVRSVHRVEAAETTVRFDVLMRILDALDLKLDVVGRGPAVRPAASPALDSRHPHPTCVSRCPGGSHGARAGPTTLKPAPARGADRAPAAAARRRTAA
jgi:Helix-turn-helix